MTPASNQLPPLPEPDTHCFDDDTGKDVWSYSAAQMHAYALAALAQQAQPVHQFRRRLCADWYDGHPDHEDGDGPYETRILYTAQQAQPVDELPDLNPEDFVVDVVLQQLGGFAPVTTHGVRVTHKPSLISVLVDSERSQHRNRQLALKALRSILAMRPAVEPMTLEQMADAIEHLCANREIAEILAANSADEYRAITAKSEGGA